ISGMPAGSTDFSLFCPRKQADRLTALLLRQPTAKTPQQSARLLRTLSDSIYQCATSSRKGNDQCQPIIQLPSKNLPAGSVFCSPAWAQSARPSSPESRPLNAA